ncbi:MAG: glutamine synthetase [Chloroflexi bacterium]|nr:glutamine synthetase [Chloroflexota bacterium]
MNSQDLLKHLADDQIQNLWILFHDYNGRACAKTLPPGQFTSAVANGIVFATANLEFALTDHMAPDGIFQPNTGDFFAVPDPDSYRLLPYLERTALVHTFMRTDEHKPFAGCPRSALVRMMDRFATLGMNVTVSLEAEFALFRKIGDGEYVPANDDGMYSLTALNRYADLMHSIVHTLEAMGMQVEALGKEYGPSQYEFTVRYANALSAVDQYLVTREVVRALALKQGLIATYMPKAYAELAGNGLHVHIGLSDASGRNLMQSDDPAQPLSPAGLHFTGGLLKHAAGLTGVGAPTVNSYKRLQPNTWAPAHVAWGVGNRGALVRVPDTSGRSHVEFRAGDSSCNPFIFMTALLAAGLDGLQNQLDPGPHAGDVNLGNLSDSQLAARGVGYLPRSLPEALDAFEADPVLTAALSPIIASEFLRVKRSEYLSYCLEVHPWERKTYLEAM